MFNVSKGKSTNLGFSNNSKHFATLFINKFSQKI